MLGNEEVLTVDNAAKKAAEYIKTIKPYPGKFSGRGIVTCAGGPCYNICAWVLINMLRKLGCELPIEVWYLGEEERDEHWIEMVKPLGVTMRDGGKVQRQHENPRHGGWALKSHAILNSSFREVLFLDADNVPVVDPTYLFDAPVFDDNYLFPLATITFFSRASLLPLGYYWPPWGPPKTA